MHYLSFFKQFDISVWDVSVLVIGFLLLLSRGLFLRLMKRVIMRFPFGRQIVEYCVLDRLSYLAPILVLKLFLPRLFHFFPWVPAAVDRFVDISILLVFSWGVDACLNLCFDFFRSLRFFRGKSIRSYFQVVKMTFYFVSSLLVISVGFDQSPMVLISGLGALTAVLMLVFRDTLLGFVGSVQLSANDMVRVGDWIEMPKYGADGNVVDVSLNTVKVQNFDKTMTMIPTYALMSDSFKNWRSMSVSGGRRVKRSVLLDVSTVCFLSPDLIVKLQDVVKRDLSEDVTNLTAFRWYLEDYLRSLPVVNTSMTLMVRDLEMTGMGLPVQLYFFVANTSWVPYEGVQSDVFDHVFAMVSVFELTLFRAYGHSV